MTYKTLPILLLIFVIGLLASSCKKAEEIDKPLVLSTIYPYELILKDILEPEITVQSIIPPGASPHTWSPNPSDLLALEQASLILSNGLGLENSIKNSLDQYSDKVLRVEDLLAIDAYEHDFPEEHHAEPEHKHDAEHEHAGPDPHIWTSYYNMMSLVDTLVEPLSQSFPTLADSIAIRTARLKSRMVESQAKISAEAAPYEGRGIITYHNSFSLFLSELGMEVIANVQSSPGSEPSPAQMTQLGRIIQAHGIKAIFVEPQMSRRSAEVLSKEFGLQILVLDPLGQSFNPTGITDYFETNWAAIKEAMEL